jgi:membrane protease YdiL (CAAX protease family)
MAPSSPSRAVLLTELACVMSAFWLPVTLTAVVVFAASRAGDITTRFAQVVHHHPLENMILGSIGYLSVAAAVPITLLVLRRSGIDRASLGLRRPQIGSDIFGALGLAILAYIAVDFLAIIVRGLGSLSSTPTNTPQIGHVPAYYIVEALIMSATTAVAEEVIMNGYLVTRLRQLNLSTGVIIVIATLMRTAYHAYYGVGMVLTIPFNLAMTIDYVMHRRLSRVVGAHFLYDFTLLSIVIFVIH